MNVNTCVCVFMRLCVCVCVFMRARKCVYDSLSLSHSLFACMCVSVYAYVCAYLCEVPASFTGIHEGAFVLSI